MFAKKTTRSPLSPPIRPPKSKRGALTLHIKSGRKSEPVSLETTDCRSLDQLERLSELPNEDIWVLGRSYYHLHMGSVLLPAPTSGRNGGPTHAGVVDGLYSAERSLLHGLNDGGTQFGGQGESKELQETTRVLRAAQGLLQHASILTADEWAEIENELFRPAHLLLRRVRDPNKIKAASMVLQEAGRRLGCFSSHDPQAVARLEQAITQLMERLQTLRDIAPHLLRRAVNIRAAIQVHEDHFKNLERLLQLPQETASAGLIVRRIIKGEHTEAVALLREQERIFQGMLPLPFRTMAQRLLFPLRRAVGSLERGDEQGAHEALAMARGMLVWAAYGREIDTELIAPLSMRRKKADREGRLIRAQQERDPKGTNDALKRIISQDDPIIKEVEQRLDVLAMKMRKTLPLAQHPEISDRVMKKIKQAQINMRRRLFGAAQDRLQEASNDL